MPALDIRTGLFLEWESQASGTVRVKRGIVQGLLPAGDSLRAMVASVLKKRGSPPLPKLRLIQAQDRSQVDRCVVEVQPEEGGPRLWYAPLLSRVEMKGREVQVPELRTVREALKDFAERDASVPEIVDRMAKEMRQGLKGFVGCPQEEEE